MNNPEGDLIGASLAAYQRSIFTNTAFCEAFLKSALQFAFRNQDEGVMVLVGAGLVCSQLDLIVSSAATERFREEDQVHTSNMLGFMAAGLPDQATRYIHDRYTAIESDIETKHPGLYRVTGQAIEILANTMNANGNLIDTFKQSALRAYRRFQLQEEMGTADSKEEESIDRSRIIPFVRKTTILEGYFKIVFDWERFVDDTFERLAAADNLKWVARLKMPMVYEEEGYENYSLFATLVGYCFLREFREAGKSFPEIDTEIDAASEAEFTVLSATDPERVLNLRREKRVRIFEEMARPDQNPNLLEGISYLMIARGLEAGSLGAFSASLGAYHAYNSIKNQLEADYWREKI